jgi:hypothetical protein
MGDVEKEDRAKVEALIESMVNSGADISAADISSDEMIEVMSHPAAPEALAAMMEIEPNTPQPGDTAPDFELRRLNDESGAGRVRLSDHAGKRPVALVFGSYT